MTSDPAAWPRPTPRILIIAGSDSGGGAGIQADIKTVTMLGGHAMTAVTAITAQNTLGVTAVHPVPTEMVIEQIDAVVSDIGVDAVKIGMIGSAETANAVADRLEAFDVPIVFDPVMIATSGSVLADQATIAAFERLMSLASVVTPNIPELAALGGEAAVLAHGCHLAAKDGHSEGNWIVDRLLSPAGTEVARQEAKKFATDDTHGTGCTFASALATGLGSGLPVDKAFVQAVRFVRIAILSAPGLGEGHGPIGHQLGVVPFDEIGGNTFDTADDLLPPAYERRVRLTNLNQVTLPARDYGEAVGFYRQLGLRQIVDSPGNGYARFECPGGATLSIHAEAAPKVGDVVVYLEVPDLDEWAAGLAAGGVVFDHQPRDESWGWREARLTDPTGNRLCLYHAGSMRRFPPWRIG